jgi:hypothetical protein
MGNKPSKKDLDKDTLEFLTKNTNFDKEAIKVQCKTLTIKGD